MYCDQSCRQKNAFLEERSKFNLRDIELLLKCDFNKLSVYSFIKSEIL